MLGKSDDQAAVLIDPSAITGMWEGPEGEYYVRVDDLFFRRHKPLEVSSDVAGEGIYVPFTWIPVEALPSGCRCISNGPVARSLTEDEIAELSEEQRKELGL